MATSTKQRLDKHEERLTLHDRQIKAMREILQEGIRLAVQWRKETLLFRKEVRELAAMQKVTEAKLQEFIASLKRGGDGHAKRRLDLE